MRQVTAAACWSVLFLGLPHAPLMAAEGDAAGHAQNVGRPRGASHATGAAEKGPGSVEARDAAASSSTAGRTERNVGSAPGGQPTPDPGRAIEMGSPGTETNPGTAGAATTSGGR